MKQNQSYFLCSAPEEVCDYPMSVDMDAYGYYNEFANGGEDVELTSNLGVDRLTVGPNQPIIPIFLQYKVRKNQIRNLDWST